MSSVLVTGGNGFLGSHVVSKLHYMSQFDQILTASRSGDCEYQSALSSVSALPLELLDKEITLPANVHTVVHIAGEKSKRSLMEAVNHIGTWKLVEASVTAQVKRFVYVSSVGVYGAHPHSGIVNEKFTHNPRNLYERSKNSGEKCVRDLCSKFGMEYIVVQPSNVIGIVHGHKYPLLGLARMVKRGRFTWFGDNESWVNYVSVEDTASAIAYATEHAPPGQTFILNTPERLKTVVSWIAEELGVVMPNRCLPKWIGSMAAYFGSAISILAARPMPFNKEKFLELTNTTQFDGSALERLTGFKYPQGLKNMIQEMVRIYLREGMI